MYVADPKDVQISSFYKKWVEILAKSSSVTTKKWHGHTFLCTPLPNGFLGGLEEQVHLFVSQYLGNPQSCAPGQLTTNIGECLNSLSQERAKHSTNVPVDKYGFFNEKIEQRQTALSTSQQKEELTDEEIARQLQQQFDTESANIISQELHDEEYAENLVLRETTTPISSFNNRFTSSISTPPKTPCRYGHSCYRKNPAHFKEFSHPPGFSYPSSIFDDDDEIIEEEDEMDDSVSIEDSRSEEEEIDKDYYPTFQHQVIYQQHIPPIHSNGSVPISSIQVDASLINPLRLQYPSISVDKIVSALKQSANRIEIAKKILDEN